MLCFLFICLLAIVVQWIYVVDGIREASRESNPATRLATFHVIVFAVIPPTLILVMSAGSEFGLRFWSFWFEREKLSSAVTVLGICYLLWAAISLVTSHRPWMRVELAIAFLSCLSVWSLLALISLA